jgi:hypothetical protein
MQADGVKQSSFRVTIFWVITACTLTILLRYFWGRFCILLAQNLFLLVLSWLCLVTVFSELLYNRHIYFSQLFKCLRKPTNSPWRRRRHIHPKLRSEAYYLGICNLAKAVIGTWNAVQGWEHVSAFWSCQLRLSCWSTYTVWIISH